jgi:hypothetical protein
VTEQPKTKWSKHTGSVSMKHIEQHLRQKNTLDRNGNSSASDTKSQPPGTPATSDQKKQ